MTLDEDVELARGLLLFNSRSSAMCARDDEHARRYERFIQMAPTWRLGAQRLDPCTARERGGFGHTLTERKQRIDATGHVASGFIKTAGNGITG